MCCHLFTDFLWIFDNITEIVHSKTYPDYLWITWVAGWCSISVSRWQWQLKHPWDTWRCVFGHGAWHAGNTAPTPLTCSQENRRWYHEKSFQKASLNPWRLYLRTGWVSNTDYRPPRKHSEMGWNWMILVRWIMITRNSTGELQIDSFERRQSFDEHCETGEATQNLQNHIWQGSGLRFYFKKSLSYQSLQILAHHENGFHGT